LSKKNQHIGQTDKLTEGRFKGFGRRAGRESKEKGTGGHCGQRVSMRNGDHGVITPLKAERHKNRAKKNKKKKKKKKNKNTGYDGFSGDCKTKNVRKEIREHRKGVRHALEKDQSRWAALHERFRRIATWIKTR